MTSPDDNKPRPQFLNISYHITSRFKTQSERIIASWKVCSVIGVFCGGISPGSSPLVSSEQSCCGSISQKPLQDSVSLLAAARSLVLLSPWSCDGVDLDCSVLPPQNHSPLQGPFRGSLLCSLQSWAMEDSFIVRPKKNSCYIVYVLYNNLYCLQYGLIW